MNESMLGLVVLAVLVLPAGCRPAASTPQPTPSHYWTALEAYEQIRPAMLDWHEDAVAIDADSLPGKFPEWRVHPDGRAPIWSFEIVSNNAQKQTVIYLTDDKIDVGIDRLTGKEISYLGASEELPILQMIDSDKALVIALRNEVSDGSVLLRVQTKTYDGARGKSIPLSWVLTYADPSDLSQEYRVFINVVTGEVLHNDFTYTPPPPTPTLKPVPDQLLIRAYGEFDLYVVNPQGQSLGIEPDSGKQIAEIPDAWYEIDSDIMTEDNVRLASALIVNPAEGNYRVHLHGSGEKEKRCRLSVEIRKGTGEEVLREVEIPCQGGVSLVYEFTLSLSGEELLSDVAPVKE